MMWFHAGPESIQDPSVKMSYGPKLCMLSRIVDVSQSGSGRLCILCSSLVYVVGEVMRVILCLLLLFLDGGPRYTRLGREPSA